MITVSSKTVRKLHDTVVGILTLMCPKFNLATFAVRDHSSKVGLILAAREEDWLVGGDLIILN